MPNRLNILKPKAMKVKITLFSFLLSITGLIAQSPGSFDLSFDGDGYLFFSPPGAADCAGYSFDITPEGSYLLGFRKNFDNPSAGIAKFLDNGALATNTFNPPNGFTDEMVNADFGYSLYQPDFNRSILIGNQLGDPAGSNIVAYDANGEIDPTFNSGFYNYTGSDEDCNQAALSVDGEIALSHAANQGPLITSVYNPDGSPNTGFDEDGASVYTGSAFDDYTGNALVYQSDGKIIVAGNGTIAGVGQKDFLLARYLPNGERDMTFGSQGIVSTDINNGYDEIIFDLVIQPDGKIIAVGGYGGDEVPATIVRYNPNGSLDTSFGNGGIHMHPLQDGLGPDSHVSVDLQPDGKIIVSGVGTFSTQYVGYVARYNIDGSLDLSFGTNGLMIPGFSVISSWFTDIKYQASNNTIVVAGYTIVPFKALMFRLNAGSVIVAVDESETEVGKLKTFPNPSKGIFQIDNIQNATWIEVFDNSGRMLISRKQSGATIDISELPAGVYVLKVLSEDQVFSTQVLKE